MIYIILTYLPAVTGLLLVYVIFTKQDISILFLVMIEMGVGLLCSVLRIEVFIHHGVGLANIPEDLFARGVRGGWMPTLIGFSSAVGLIIIARWRERRC